MSDQSDASGILNTDPNLNGAYQTDTYKKAACGIPPTDSISSVTVWLRGMGQAPLNVYAVLYISGVPYLSSALHFGSGTSNVSAAWTSNPNDSSAWTPGAIDALEVGVKANANLVYGTWVFEVWLVITYTLPGTGHAILGDGLTWLGLVNYYYNKKNNNKPPLGRGRRFPRLYV